MDSGTRNPKKSDGLLGEGVPRVNQYRFIDTQKANYTVKLLCRALKVPESSYYDWNRDGRRIADQRAVERDVLLARIRAVHEGSDRTYGAERVWHELRRQDPTFTVALRTVAELMADAGIAGVSGRERSTTTTRRDRLAAPFPDLVGRWFQPILPNHTWYGDITYIWVDGRFWYLATVIDGCTKEVLGWAISDHMRTELITDALHRAVRRRGGRIPPGVIFHSDRGSQYTSNEYGLVCDMYKIRRSMGRRGVCYDNAAAESFFSTIKRELINRYRWNSIRHLKNNLFAWIESWYNRRRLHSSIGFRPPVEAYETYMSNQTAA